MPIQKKDEKRVPELRFGEFEGEWEEKKWDDIYEFQSTNSFSRDCLNYEIGDVYNIHYGDIHTKFAIHFDLKLESVPFVNSDLNITRIKEESYLQKGDLVIADASEDYNDVGKTIEIVNLENKKVIAGLHTFLARRKENFPSIGFAGHLLRSRNIRLQIMRIAQGTKVLGISKSRVSKITLLLPETPEQQKIANFLTAVDRRIQLLQDKATHLQAYKKGIMQQLFSRQLRFKDENGEEFGAWEEKRLGDYYSNLRTGMTPRRVNPEYYKGSIPWITSGELNYNIITETNENITDEAVKATNLKLYEQGTFFIAITGLEAPGTRGKCAINGVPATTNQSCMAFIKIPEINTSFLFYWYRNYAEQLYCRFAQGTKQQSFNNSIVEKFNINIPSISEQQKIANFLSKIDERMALVKAQIEQMQTWKKGLLQKMLV